MLAPQRHKLIVEEIRRQGAVRVSELTELLSVSEMTVRRDLDVLAAAGLLEKVHGGATLRGGLSAEEPGFEAKSHRQLKEKRAIARRPPRSSSPGQSIGLTAGTTTCRLAHHLRAGARPDGRHELDAGGERPPPGARPDLTVVLTGGVRTPSDALVGPIALTAIRSLHLDVLFMGVHGVTADAGPDHAEPPRGRDQPRARRCVGADHRRRRPYEVGHPRSEPDRRPG